MRKILVVVTVLLVLSPTLGAQTPQIFGDRMVIPDERLGDMRLGTPREVIWARFGAPAQRVIFPMKWTWPKNLGMFWSWGEGDFRGGFCDSNDRMFVAYARVPFFPISVPEGLTTKSGFDAFISAYGPPVARVAPLGLDPMHIFANGFVSGGGLWAIGVFNPSVCDSTEPIRGIYIPFLGRSEIKRVGTSKIGDEKEGVIGPPTARFRKDDRVYFLIEFAFSPAKMDRTLNIRRKFIQPDGTLYGDPPPETRVVRAGATSLIYVTWLGRIPPRADGRWRLQLTIGNLSIVTVEFEQDGGT